MSEDLIAGIGRLIDGDMDRRERLELLGALARHPRARDLLHEATRLDIELSGLAETYRRAEPDGAMLDRILSAVADGSESGLLGRAVDSVRDALRQMTRMSDAELRMAMGGSAPPPAFDDGPYGDGPYDQAEPWAPDSGRTLPAARPPEADRSPEPAPLFRLVQGTDGRLDFRFGAGSLRAAPAVGVIDLGPAGSREEGGWVLRLIAGEARQTEPGRVDIVGTPEVGGCLILLDGSSLLFTAPLSIRWQPADDGLT